MPEKKKGNLEFPISKNYSPIVTIEVLNGINNQSSNVVAIVDTGFTGFLQLPLSVALSSQLNLWGTSNSILADGSRIQNIDCIGSIKIGNKRVIGIISLTSTGSDSLLGMQFLQQLGGSFKIDFKNQKAIFEFEE